MTIEFNSMDQAATAVELSRKCLNKYENKKPREFLQLDHWGEDGELSLGTTWELMQGMPVRVLINGDVADKQRLVEMLQDIAKWIEADESIEARIKGLGDFVKYKQDDLAFDAGEIPF